MATSRRASGWPWTRVWFGLILGLGWIAAAAGEAGAQQTIINVPSDDLTPKGQHFVLHESAILPRKTSQSFATTNFYTYGLFKNTELAATLYNVDNSGSREMALGLGFKSVFKVFREQAPDFRTKFTIGHMTPFSLQPRNIAAGYFSYTHLSFDIPKTDLRLLGGVAAGSQNLIGKDAVSAIVGVEYPITEHLSFTGEWFSGDHNFSALIPGFTYHRNDWILVAGYKLSNDFNPKEAGVVLEVGRFFGGTRKLGGEREGHGEEDEAHEEDEDDEPRHFGMRPPRRRRFGLF